MTASLFSEASVEDLDALGLTEALYGSEQAGFAQSLAGQITPAGALGNVLQDNSIEPTGQITPVGELSELSVGIEDFGGVLMLNGSLAMVISGYTVSVGGAVEPEGGVSHIQGLVHTGSITPVGNAIMPTFLSVGGSITPSAGLASNILETAGDPKARRPMSLSIMIGI